jgi:diguanylate cyclase (GGDEF)-like protein
MGDLLLKHVRGEDIACRYGGDEFIIVLPDATREVTRERAELIARHASQLHYQVDSQSIGTATLSLGVGVFPENGVTSTAILRAADAALYRAKREGRGRVAVAE